MDNTGGEDTTITREKAQELADTYLKQQHYNYNKIVFHSCESMKAGEAVIFEFSGLITEKSRSLMDFVTRDKSSLSYKFVIDIDAKNGRVLNYVLT